MADITDRPQAAPTFTPGPGESGLPYRPLSGLAIAGFVLGAAYALVVLAGGVLAYSRGSPWLMPAWSALVPLAALLVCALARRRIRAAEGTLAGSRLANWGIGLSLAVGLTYWAYWSATFLAVRQQASNFVQNQWFKALADGDLNNAFLLTIQPGNRPTGDLRAELEVNFNFAGDPNTPGGFTRFSQLEFVRAMLDSGPDSTYALAHTGVPSVEKGGLQVPLLYHVRSRYAEFDLLVTVNGTSARGKGQPGRQWYVVAEQSGMKEERRQLTEEGQTMARDTDDALRMVRGWVRMVSSPNPDLEGAYRQTLPADRRKSPDPKADDAAARSYRAGLRAFKEGGIVRADKDTFWGGDEKQQAEVVDGTRKMFAEQKDWMKLAPVSVRPLIRRDGDRLHLAFDAQMLVKDKFAVGGRVVAVADVKGPDARPTSWRVESLDLVRARSVPKEGPMGRTGRAR